MALQLRSDPTDDEPRPVFVDPIDVRRAPTVVAAGDPMRQFEPERLEAGLRCSTTQPTTPLGIEAEGFVYDVYRTSGFCAESMRRHVEETEPWRAGSSLHVVTDHDHGSQIVGVARTVIAPFEDLPTARHADAGRLPAGTGLVCEIGSLAVRANQRGLGVANELHRTAFLSGFTSGVSGFCFLVEEWMLDFFSDVYGLPVHRLGPPRAYMGGDVIPAALWLPEMLDVIAVDRPGVYRWAVEDLAESLQERLHLPTGTR